MKGALQILIIACTIFVASPLFSQDLDPRAYLQVPIGTTTVVPGFAYSYGGVVTDATLPIKDIKSHVQSVSIGTAHSFNLFGLSAQALVAVPYVWAQVK